MLPLIPAFQAVGYRLLFDLNETAQRIIGVSSSEDFSGADCILCGYDAIEAGDAASRIIPWAKNRSIPTIGLLDSWKGVDRFWYENGSMRPLTDRLAVPDEAVKTWLIGNGVPDSWPVVTGHPGIEEVFYYRDIDRKKRRYEARDQLSLDLSDRVLVFFSEPVLLSNGKRQSLMTLPVADDGIKTVDEWICNRYSNEFRLVYRHHPIEENNHYENWLDGNNLTSKQILFCADQVVGLGSTMMAYAVSCGIHTECIDNIVVGWTPEQSRIPTSLWDDLIETGIFQNNPDRIVNKSSFPSKLATEKILDLVKSVF